MLEGLLYVVTKLWLQRMEISDKSVNNVIFIGIKILLVRSPSQVQRQVLNTDETLASIHKDGANLFHKLDAVRWRQG